MGGQGHQIDRALGALMGVALGDALGMPSQTLSRARIVEAYGRITDLVEPIEGHPVSHGLRAGMVTDDTEQTLLLADLMIRSPERFDDRAWAEALLGWEHDVRARGLRDLLGPSSKRALDALLAGAPPSETGREGTTNGAAMRIAPVGIATPPDDPVAFVDRVAEACLVTHNTREAISAAAAVAMTISLGIGGASFVEAMGPAVEAARIGAALGAPVGEADMGGLILAALHLAERGFEEDLVARIGTSVASREAVPAAFGVVALANCDPWQAGLIAANIGDDTDTIGAIACAMAAACTGLAALPKDKVDKVVAANGLDLVPVAEGLLAIRAQRKSGLAS